VTPFVEKSAEQTIVAGAALASALNRG